MSDSMEKEIMHSGFVAIIGRPNSGKSTLLNATLGEQLAIISPMPQTTQRNMRGIYNEENLQIIFVDTPGIHKGRHQLNKDMYNLSISTINDSGIDVLCYIVDMTRDFGEEEDNIVQKISKVTRPVCVIMNKIDCLTFPEAQQKCEQFNERYPALAEVPQIMLSAKAEDAGNIFISFMKPYIPEGPQYYPEDHLTDASLRYFAAEYIRKQIIDLTYEEVPHASYVDIVGYRESDELHEIDADIHVESVGQKAILIGTKGITISQIRRGAEKRLRGLTGTKTKINLFIKVTRHWRDKAAFLREAGFHD